MRNPPTRILPALILTLATVSPAPAQAKVVELIVEPSIKLIGPQAVYTLLVAGKAPHGALVDLTHDAKYRSSNPAIAKVSSQGILRGITDGKTEVTVETAGKTASVKVEVTGAKDQRIYHFENDI